MDLVTFMIRGSIFCFWKFLVFALPMPQYLVVSLINFLKWGIIGKYDTTFMASWVVSSVARHSPPFPWPSCTCTMKLCTQDMHQSPYNRHDTNIQFLWHVWIFRTCIPLDISFSWIGKCCHAAPWMKLALDQHYLLSATTT